MFRSIVAGAALSLCLASSTVAGPFEDYLEFCVKSDASAVAAASGAEAAGWSKLPPELFAEEGAPFHDPSVYMNADLADLDDKAPTDLRMVMTGWGEGEEIFDLEGMRLDFCMVGIIGGDYEALKRRIAGHFDFAPALVDGEEVWAYSRQGARLQSEAALFESDEVPAVAAQGRKVFVSGLLQEDGMVVLLLGAIRPSN